MNSKQKKTLEAIFTDPVRSDIPWREVESLLKCLGSDVTQGNGSRVRVFLNGVRATFHEPHPERVICKGAVKSVKTFLTNAGVTPALVEK